MTDQTESQMQPAAVFATEQKLTHDYWDPYTEKIYAAPVAAQYPLKLSDGSYRFQATETVIASSSDIICRRMLFADGVLQMLNGEATMQAATHPNIETSTNFAWTPTASPVNGNVQLWTQYVSQTMPETQMEWEEKCRRGLSVSVTEIPLAEDDVPIQSDAPAWAELESWNPVHTTCTAQDHLMGEQVAVLTPDGTLPAEGDWCYAITADTLTASFSGGAVGAYVAYLLVDGEVVMLTAEQYGICWTQESADELLQISLPSTLLGASGTHTACWLMIDRTYDLLYTFDTYLYQN